MKEEHLWLIILEDFLPTLPLCGEAGDGPHLDLHPGVELLPPHVPHSVAGRGYRAVLKQHCSLTTCTHDCVGKHSQSYCSYTLTLERAATQVCAHARTYTQTQTFFLKTHRTHTHSSSIPKCINTHFCTSIHNLKKRKHAVQPEEHLTSKVNDKYHQVVLMWPYILLQKLCDASKLG